LPVVSRDDKTQLVGYLNRSSFLSAWRRQIDEEHVREEGWLNPYFRFHNHRKPTSESTAVNDETR